MEQAVCRSQGSAEAPQGIRNNRSQRGGGAIESASGRIYVGVCVDGACTLGICAERNAVFNMLINGEDAIRRVVAVNWDGKVMPPCGACREFLYQLNEENEDMEIMADYGKRETVTLKELMPNWWGKERYEQSKR